MRVVGWNVQPIVMADDGENLTPVNVGSQTLSVTQWDAFKAGGDVAALDGIRAQIETVPNGDAKPEPVKRRAK